MSFINHHTKEINCKVVYYGPGLGGKTTNIQYIYQKTSTDRKNEMISLDTDNERTLFFDFLPLDLGEIRGFKVRFHLYTVPGQAFYEASRKLILRGVDGIIFVADSQVERMEANIESLESLWKHLEELKISKEEIPLIMQWNKADLPNIANAQTLNEQLNTMNVPAFEASAIKGDGVFDSLQEISKKVLTNLQSVSQSFVGQV